MKKLIVVVACVLMSVSLLWAGGGKESADKPIELKMGTKMPEESIEGRAFQHFADLVKERNNGSVIVYVYPSEQLGDTMTQIDNVALGSQDIYAESVSYFARYDERLQIEDIPFLFQGDTALADFYKTELGKDIIKNLEANGFKLLNPQRNFVRGPYRVLCATKPIRSLDDVKGLRLRTFDSDVYMKAWDRLGANPIVIPWTETYLALKQGTVDGVTSPISLVLSMKFSEVARYITVIKEFPQTCDFVMNKGKFDSLTPKQQEVLLQAAYDAGEFANKLTFELIDSQIEGMKTENNAEFIQIDTVPFKKALTDFYAELKDKGLIPAGMELN
jgi:tripartite ATP-independent transporter DctP family solute receptor